MLQIQLEYGLWGVILGFVGVAIGSVLDVSENSGHDFIPFEGNTALELPDVAPYRPVQTARAPIVGTNAQSLPLEKTRHLGARQPAKAWLVVRTGNRTGKQLGMTLGRNVIGRDGNRCNLILDDETISGQHAQIRYENGQFVLYDMASTNGTYVNGRRIQREPLMDNDVVRFGTVKLVFKAVK